MMHGVVRSYTLKLQDILVQFQICNWSSTF